MIEQISGSIELKAEYERLKLLQDQMTEASTLNFNKKKTVQEEMRHFKEQKEEADKYQKLLMKRVFFRH